MHVSGIGLLGNLYGAMFLGYLLAECLHAFTAAVVDRAASINFLAVGKHLGIVLHHTEGNATMLLGTKRRQLATVALGVLPHLLQAFLDATPQLRQVLVVGKLLVHPLVTAVRR